MNEELEQAFYLEQLNKAEETYNKLQKHVVDDDLEPDEVPLLDHHITKVREEIIELKQVLGIYHAS